MRRRLVWMGGGLAVVLCLQVMIFELATVPPEDDNVDDAGGGTPHNHQEQRPLNFVPITVQSSLALIPLRAQLLSPSLSLTPPNHRCISVSYSVRMLVTAVHTVGCVIDTE